jgi:nucleoside-diphosphate-sugar epimerase
MGWYLVTGAAGFIGSRVAARLLDAGHDVVGLDNLNDAYDARVKHWRLARLEAEPRFMFYRADVADRAAVDALFEAQAGRCEAVVNLAARAGVRQSVENPWVYVETNVTGTLNLLEACRERGIGKFVLASTSSLYGAHNPQPFREDADTDRPLSPYAASKKGAEAMCHSYHALSGIDVTVLRYFTVYGPAGRPDMALFRFVQAISEGRHITVYGDGTQSRDFTYVDDIAEGTVAALQPVGYEVINLGSDEPIVLRDAIRLVERLVGHEAVVAHADRHPADVPATWADISKAERVLGWRPRTRFEEGVARLVEWYQANREWAKDIATG